MGGGGGAINLDIHLCVCVGGGGGGGGLQIVYNRTNTKYSGVTYNRKAELDQHQ